MNEIRSDLFGFFLLSLVILGVFLSILLFFSPMHISDFISASEVSSPILNASQSCPTPIVNLSCPGVSCQDNACPNMTCNCPNQWVVYDEYTSQLQEVAASVPNERPYEDKEAWDCDDMAKEVKARLKNAGFPKCRTAIGEYYLNESDHETHMWVVCDEIIVEATTGEIIGGADYWRYS